MTRVIRKTLTRRESNAAHRFYGALTGRPPMFVDRERKRATRPSNPLQITERQVLHSVIGYLRRHPQIATVERSQSGLFQAENRIVRVGFVGKLDITGMTKRGQYFEIEVKRPGGRLTEAQADRIARIKSGGGISGVVTSIEETEALLRG